MRSRGASGWACQDLQINDVTRRDARLWKFLYGVWKGGTMKITRASSGDVTALGLLISFRGGANFD